MSDSLSSTSSFTVQPLGFTVRAVNGGGGGAEIARGTCTARLPACGARVACADVATVKRRVNTVAEAVE